MTKNIRSTTRPSPDAYVITVAFGLSAPDTLCTGCVRAIYKQKGFPRHHRNPAPQMLLSGPFGWGQDSLRPEVLSASYVGVDLQDPDGMKCSSQIQHCSRTNYQRKYIGGDI